MEKATKKRTLLIIIELQNFVTYIQLSKFITTEYVTYIQLSYSILARNEKVFWECLQSS